MWTVALDTADSVTPATTCSLSQIVPSVSEPAREGSRPDPWTLECSHVPGGEVTVGVAHRRNREEERGRHTALHRLPARQQHDAADGLPAAAHERLARRPGHVSLFLFPGHGQQILGRPHYRASPTHIGLHRASGLVRSDADALWALQRPADIPAPDKRRAMVSGGSPRITAPGTSSKREKRTPRESAPS
ncbi:hypothetical protein ON010_g17413 [Phytophthora cinnamomi]|nr:hypothetical protein ON010_g17413 [Phytophthora cinnamomi]